MALYGAAGRSLCGSMRRSPSALRTASSTSPWSRRSPGGNPRRPEEPTEAIATVAMRAEGPIKSRRSALDA
jgi:hypothetical protein